MTGYDINLVCEGCIGWGEDQPRYSPHNPLLHNKCITPNAMAISHT